MMHLHIHHPTSKQILVKKKYLYMLRPKYKTTRTLRNKIFLPIEYRDKQYILEERKFNVTHFIMTTATPGSRICHLLTPILLIKPSPAMANFTAIFSTFPYRKLSWPKSKNDRANWQPFNYSLCTCGFIVSMSLHPSPQVYHITDTKNKVHSA